MREKIVYDEKEDDIEYLKDNINELKGLKNTLTKINIMTTRLNISVLMKQLDICLKIMMKTIIYTRLTNNISQFLRRLYCYSMNI